MSPSADTQTVSKVNGTGTGTKKGSVPEAWEALCSIVQSTDLRELFEKNKILEDQVQELTLAVKGLAKVNTDQEKQQKVTEASLHKIKENEYLLKAEKVSQENKVREAINKAKEADTALKNEMKKSKTTEILLQKAGDQNERTRKLLEQANQDGAKLRNEAREVQSLRASVKSFQAFGAPLSETEDDITRASNEFGSLYTQCSSLMEEYVFQREPAINRVDELREAVRKYQKFHDLHEIPLPINSGQQGQFMRFAVAMQILGHALSTHVFQPVWTEDGDSWIAGTLYGLNESESLEDVGRAAHARSIVLNLSPDRHIEMGHRRASHGVAVVTKILNDLVSEVDRQSFVEGLEHIFSTAVGVWSFVQHIKSLFFPEMQPFEDGDEDWKELRIPSTSSHSQSSLDSKGKIEKTADTTSAAKPQVQGTMDTARSNEAEGRSDVGVWPLITEGDIILCPGSFIKLKMIYEADSLVRKEEDEAKRERNNTAARQGVARSNTTGSKRRMSFLGSSKAGPSH